MMRRPRDVTMRRTRVWLLSILLAMSACRAVPAQAEDAVAAYVDQIAQRIAQQPGYQELIGGKQRLRAFLQIAVTTGGQLDYVAVDLSSGDSKFDQAAMALVYQTQSFGELPHALVEQSWFVFILSIPLP